MSNTIDTLEERQESVEVEKQETFRCRRICSGRQNSNVKEEAG